MSSFQGGDATLKESPAPQQYPAGPRRPSGGHSVRPSAGKSCVMAVQTFLECNYVKIGGARVLVQRATRGDCRTRGHWELSGGRGTGLWDVRPKPEE